ncbi:MAG: hypothetical protein LBV27_00800, partial [Oscillospiraceae bacterium]|nr:hypothetical protein [Oscillospiraceae bacterium]
MNESRLAAPFAHACERFKNDSFLKFAEYISPHKVMQEAAESGLLLILRRQSAHISSSISRQALLKIL